MTPSYRITPNPIGWQIRPFTIKPWSILPGSCLATLFPNSNASVHLDLCTVKRLQILRFYPIYKVASWPAIISWVLSKHKTFLGQRHRTLFNTQQAPRASAGKCQFPLSPSPMGLTRKVPDGCFIHSGVVSYLSLRNPPLLRWTANKFTLCLRGRPYPTAQSYSLQA